MKFIPVLLAMAVAAVAAPSDPGETAVHFLEKVRAKNLNLEPGADTALSLQTSDAKRKEIARRLERMARDIGNDPLEVGEVKLDGDLAGVLVRKVSGFDPNRMQVFAIALVKRGAQWAAAPVPASFENSGVGYTAALRIRLNALENWMLREQVLDLADLRDQSEVRMRRKIEETLPTATLRTLDSQQAVERFLKACETRNKAEMFGLLGGLSAILPSNWPLRIKAIESAVAADSEAAYPWRQLISNNVLRMIVHHEEDARSALVSIACLDPAGNGPSASRPRVRLIHLDLTKPKDGLWSINLPGYFLQERENPDGAADDDDLDSDLLDAFPAKIGELYPALPHPTADEARQAVMDALHQGSLPSLMRLIRLEGPPADARESCSRAAQLWWTFREPSSLRLAVPLSIHEADGNAAATFQVFPAHNPDRFDFQTLYFKKAADGWFWIPKPGPETTRSFHEWTDVQAGQWRNDWQDALLTDCPVLENIPDAGAPTEEESRKLIESWHQAVHAGNIKAALRCTARLNLPDSNATLLRNLGYELTGAHKSLQKPSITGVYRDGGWSTVGTRNDSDDKPSFPLHPIIASPSGPRILLEIDLSASGTRSRDFLNKTTLKRLATFSPQASIVLKELFSQHQSAVSKPETP